MNRIKQNGSRPAEQRFRYMVNKCRRCEACRDLLGLSCLFFPKLFQLADKAALSSSPISKNELRELTDWCHFCALCPCSDVRSAILDAKTEFMDEQGLSLSIRILEDAAMIGRMGGMMPMAANRLLKSSIIRRGLEAGLGIHQERKLPSFPVKNKTKSVRDSETGIKPTNARLKIAYFSGCSARYLYPEVIKATIKFFEENNCQVIYPEQGCCGLPSYLEGDKAFTLKKIHKTVDQLFDLIQKGFDIVCSCPTCGYMLKKVLAGGTEFALWRQAVVSKDKSIAVPVTQGPPGPGQNAAVIHVPARLARERLSGRDYFSSLDPDKRLMVAANTYDAGECAAAMLKAGDIELETKPRKFKAVYFPSCHTKQLKIGRPYHELLNRSSDKSLTLIEGTFCCGNAGIMGLKKEFFQPSIKIASRLISEIKKLEPEFLVTDCLSCRMQFEQLTDYQVVHPMQLLSG